MRFCHPQGRKLTGLFNLFGKHPMGNGCEHVDKGASASSAALYCLCTVLKRGASAPCALAHPYRSSERMGEDSAGESAILQDLARSTGLLDGLGRPVQVSFPSYLYL